MATYSLAVTGVQAGYVSTIESVTLPDTSATAGGMVAAMQNNTPLFCKGPDGGFDWYRLDAQRSTPDVPVLVRM